MFLAPAPRAGNCGWRGEWGPEMHRIVFGQKSDWADLIRSRLDRERFEVEFADFWHPESALEAYECAVPLLVKHYEPLRSRWAHTGAKFLIPEERAVWIAADKLETILFLQSRGFGRHIPDVYSSQPRYPFIYKKRMSGNGEDVEIIHSAEQHGSFEVKVDTGSWFRQRYVAGRREYTSHFISACGTLKYAKTFCFEFDVDYFIKGARYAPSAVGETHTPFLPLFERILRELGYDGTCCFNFKIEDGIPLIFEINPRFGGSLCRDINAYLDAYLSVLAEATESPRRHREERI